MCILLYPSLIIEKQKNYRIVDGERATMSSIHIIAIVILWECAAGRTVSVLKVTVLVFFRSL